MHIKIVGKCILARASTCQSMAHHTIFWNIICSSFHRRSYWFGYPIICAAGETRFEFRIKSSRKLTISLSYFLLRYYYKIYISFWCFETKCGIELEGIELVNHRAHFKQIRWRAFDNDFGILIVTNIHK